MTYPLTKRHFATYKRAFERYAAKYNITGWQMEFYHEVSADAMAWVKLNHEAHRADIYLATQWDEEPTRDRLYAKARHECFHVFVGHLSGLAERRYVTETELTGAEEELVIRLMTITPDL